MFGKGEQKEIQITGIANKVVNGNDSSTNNFFNSQSSKLSALFIRLKNVFDDTENPEELINISENLKKYLINSSLRGSPKTSLTFIGQLPGHSALGPYSLLIS